jgi:poly(beta-D-mannuronate) lyase
MAPVGGVTTSNSGYPRSELREMNGSSAASWSNTSGVHTMTVTEAITHLPAVKPHVVAAQIHDAQDDVVMIRLEGSNLFVEQNGNSVGTLDAAYRLGTVFTVKLVAADGHIKVFYNGVLKLDVVRAGSGWYFKAGCYTQSNPTKGDAPDAYGEVVIYGLDVTHA